MARRAHLATQFNTRAPNTFTPSPVLATQTAPAFSHLHSRPCRLLSLSRCLFSFSLCTLSPLSLLSLSLSFLLLSVAFVSSLSSEERREGGQAGREVDRDGDGRRTGEKRGADVSGGVAWEPMTEGRQCSCPPRYVSRAHICVCFSLLRSVSVSLSLARSLSVSLVAFLILFTFHSGLADLSLSLAPLCCIWFKGS